MSYQNPIYAVKANWVRLLPEFIPFPPNLSMVSEVKTIFVTETRNLVAINNFHTAISNIYFHIPSHFLRKRIIVGEICNI